MWPRCGPGLILRSHEAAGCPFPPPSEPVRAWGLLGEYLRHPGNALVADPHRHDRRGVGIHGPPLRLEEHRDLLPGLPAELAADRGRVQWLRRGRLLLVVDLQVCLIAPDGVDVGVARGLLGSFPRLPPILRAADSGEAPCLDEHPWLTPAPQDLFLIRVLPGGLFPLDRICDLGNDVPLETVANRSGPMACGPNVDQPATHSGPVGLDSWPLTCGRRRPAQGQGASRDGWPRS
jgi:hypothetical protein